jgi:hypothetical protein
MPGEFWLRYGITSTNPATELIASASCARQPHGSTIAMHAIRQT